MKPGTFPKNPSFLIVSLRYIGDVLLSTPLALSIKTHLPDATVDYVVFKGTEGVLAKNPYVRQVHTIEPGASGWQTALKILRRYDYSIAANPSDRTTSFTLFGGRRSVGFYLYKRQDWWKKLFLTHSNFFEQQHVVPLMLSHLNSLGIPAISRVVMGYDEADERFVEEKLGGKDYILLHPFTRQPYKYWPTGHWARLAGLVEKELGIRAIFTRSGFASDEKQFQAIEAAADCKLQSFPQPFTLNQLAAAIHKCRAFVGVDTVATHIAAALEVPVVALYGPTMVNCWGPWPNGHTSTEPYARLGRIQKVQNTTVLQQSWPCIPCNKEFCMLSKSTKMECLENISPETVLASLKLPLPRLV